MWNKRVKNSIFLAHSQVFAMGDFVQLFFSFLICCFHDILLLITNIKFNLTF